jgi:ribonuclease HII
VGAVNPRFSFDLEHGGGGPVAGADEAGRGCLAGPLVAAAVCFDYRPWRDADFAALDLLDDSKKLTRRRRAVLYDEIVARARRIAVVSCSARSIDERGLQRCNIEALERAVTLLGDGPSEALVDGYRLGDGAPAHQRLIGGDGRSAAVAAASVIAKVTRDRLMGSLHECWPQYGFDHHVGYACAEHQRAIVEHGVCPQHRMSFQSVAYQQLGLEPA